MSAQIPASCTIGPYCTIGPNVTLGEDCELISHVVLEGNLTMGSGNKVFPFACLGVAPQDLKYAGEPTGVRIGNMPTASRAVGAVASLGAGPMFGFTTMVRADAPAEALGVGGFFLVAGAARSPAGLAAGVALLVLSALT